MQENTEEIKWALESGIQWLGWFSICSTIKKVCMEFLDYSLFAYMPLLQKKKIMNPYLGSIRIIALGKSEPDQSGSFGLLELYFGMCGSEKPVPCFKK